LVQLLRPYESRRTAMDHGDRTYPTASSANVHPAILNSAFFILNLGAQADQAIHNTHAIGLGDGRMHRDGQHLLRHLLGDRERTLAQANCARRLLLMDRDGVVDARADATLDQRLSRRVAALAELRRDTQGVLVVDVRALREDRGRDQARVRVAPPSR
jgi:hypothetical protein